MKHLPEKSDKELDQVHDTVVLGEGNLIKEKRKEKSIRITMKSFWKKKKTTKKKAIGFRLI